MDKVQREASYTFHSLTLMNVLGKQLLNIATWRYRLGRVKGGDVPVGIKCANR